MARTRKRSSPRQGETLLDGLFKRVRLEQPAREWRALGAWHRAAGPRIAARVRSERILGTTMVLRAASAAWANELGFLRAQLLERLRETPGAEWIEELRFTVGPLDGLPSWEDEERPARRTKRATAGRVDDVAVGDALQAVSDPELRAALAEWYARARAR